MSRKKKQQPVVHEVDLEATAELPLMDFDAPPEDAADATDAASGGATDTFVALAVPGTLAMPEGAPDLTESLREVESNLKRKTERLRELEARLAAAELERNAAVEQAERTRSETRALLEEQRADEARAAEELSRRLAAAEQSLALAQGSRDGDLHELRRRAERQAEALRHTHGMRAVFDAMLAERDAQVAELESRHAADMAESSAQNARLLEEAAAREAALAAELQSLRASASAREAELEARLREREADLEARLRDREAELESRLRERETELATTRGELEAAAGREKQLAGELEAGHARIAGQDAELSSLRETEEAAQAAVQLFAQQKDRISGLERELAAARDRAAILEGELRAAQEQIERLETDARASASLLGNLQQNIARLGKDETGTRPALKVVGGTDQLPGRFLVSEESEGRVRYALGRRSTIGRTPENDIQIDANFVSRRHAVILGSAQHCIIEDLDSVNGVQVNGKRVTRHFLRDGDMVTIGRTTFHFLESPPQE